MDPGIAGRAGIITGASGGIGSALAQAFVDAGARVALVDLDAKAAGQLSDRLGGETVSIGADIAEQDQVAEAFRITLGAFGRLDFLINNAGLRMEYPFLEHPIEGWRRTLEVNLTGAFLCAQYAAQQMLRQGGGKIVNIASIAAVSAVTGRAAYVASKAGLLGLTRALAWELGSQGIYCNAIVPGVIETPLTAHYFTDEDRVRALEMAIALRRHGQPDDLSGPAIFLCSAASDYVQGAVLPVDGGWLAGKGY